VPYNLKKKQSANKNLQKTSPKIKSVFIKKAQKQATPKSKARKSTKKARIRGKTARLATLPCRRLRSSQLERSYFVMLYDVTRIHTT